MEEGPISGITLILFSWAYKISLAPGSAIFGQPASVNSPIFSPLMQGPNCFDVIIGSSSSSTSKFSQLISFSGQIRLINPSDTLLFSTTK